MSAGRMLSIILFVLVAIAHLARLLLGIEVTLDGQIIPMWFSVLGTIVPAALALMLFNETGVNK